MRVLLVDHDAVARQSLRAALQGRGHDCDDTADGAEGLGLFAGKRHDVVLAGQQRSGRSGLQLCREVRAQPSGLAAYVIVISEVDEPADAEHGAAAGADDYLAKPVSVDQLLLRLSVAERVVALHRRLERVTSELETSARTDSLTQLGNRMALAEDLERLHARVARYGHCYCVVLFDVDHFAAFNDEHGQEQGDSALAAVAGVLRRQCRKGDAAYRYGGEQFLWLLPEQPVEGAMVATDRMRRAVTALAIPHPGNEEHGVVTVSGGIARLVQGDGQEPGDVLAAADVALYRAKERGRNRIEVAAPPTGGMG